MKPIYGTPGVRAINPVEFRRLFRGNWEEFLPGGRLIDSTKTRDVDNAGYQTHLRAGLLMGKVTATGKYANCIIGQLQGAKSATNTSVTLSAAQAVELVRRVGATGTIRLVGPPTATGTVATWTETYSAVDQVTGIVTCSALDADLVAGSFVCQDDGSYLPISFVPEGAGIQISDPAIPGAVIDQPLPQVSIKGTVIASQLLPWPSNTNSSLQQWVMDRLNAAGKFVFDSVY